MAHLSITTATATKFSFDVRPYHYPCSSQFRRRSIIIPLASLSKHHHHQQQHSRRSRRRRRNSLREKLLSFPGQEQDQHQHQHQDSHLLGGGVSVNEDGVIKRSQLPEACSSDALEDVINSKIVKPVLLVEDKGSSLIRTVQTVSIWDVPLFRTSHHRAATVVFCAFCIFAAIAKLFPASGRVELKREEVEMLRRKKKQRMEKDKLGKGRVKILQNVQELPAASDSRPQLDKNELIKCIEHAEKSGTNLLLPDSPCHHSAKDCDFYSEFKETREMTREVQELERQDCAQNDERGKGNLLPDSPCHHSAKDCYFYNKVKETREMTREVQELERQDCAQNDERGKGNLLPDSLCHHSAKDYDFYSKVKETREMTREVEELERQDCAQNDERGKGNLLPDSPCHHSAKDCDFYSKVKETREMTREVHELEQQDCAQNDERGKGNELSSVVRVSKPHTTVDACIKSKPVNIKLDQGMLSEMNNDGNASQFKRLPDAAQESLEKHDVEGLSRSENSRSEKSFQFDSAGSDYGTETLEIKGHASWIEDNFQQFDPIIKMIGSGFRENYMVAKEKVHQSVVSTEISELGLLGEDEELEWMNDEKLREIVFQVRDNELAGRDPFYLMDAGDQRAFFKGLELKAEMVNEKLLGLHKWVHSRIENLDYGADGISLDDPLEKIVPRWKGPIIDKELGFVDKVTENQMSNFARNVEQSLQKSSEELPYSKDVSPYSHVNDKNPNGPSTSVNTLIECSDGSGRPGRKMGKEHWQHTKKWSRGFLEVYNSENDPEIKSIMKDMGKGLDRWITEKETEEVADLMTRLPKRKRRYIQKKMDKLKREVDMYGAQAVISKYKEYSDEKGEDYLWWLDLQFVLCIELYTVEDGVQKVGFYSLEMAADLELNPAQYHVIAFEDPGDSKNFCYILQAHMDMLGSGTGFVVARPPKDAFREAKAHGFNVTVIRKGELVFNVDQTLEEVEEQITEIGNEMYHDKIMKERGVDIRSLMRGLVLADRAARR